MKLDFEGLNDTLMRDAGSYIARWLPGGKLIGREWTCGDLSGSSGKSLKVNLNTGKWSDFNAGDAGGDLISLYAAINRLDQKQAYIKLIDEIGYKENSKPIEQRERTRDKVVDIAPPPKGTSLPDQLVKSKQKWAYRDENNNILFFITRFTDKSGKKQFCPWSWTHTSGWVRKHWPTPRPLLGLPELKSNPNKPVLIVEGEKCYDAAKKLQQTYIVVTWPGGSKAVDRTDWSPLKGRKVLIWPDADQAGYDAASEICQKLRDISRETKAIFNIEGKPDGWDCADAVAEGMTFKSFVDWAKPIVTEIKPIQKAEVIPPPPEAPIPSDEPPLPTVQDMPVEVTQMLEDLAGDHIPAQATGNDQANWVKLGLTMNATGSAPILNANNVLKVLTRSDRFKGLLWFDEFHQKIFRELESGEVAEWSDLDTTILMIELQENLLLSRLTRLPVEDAIHVLAHRNKRNEPKDYFADLKWDSAERVEMFLSKYMGAEDNEYTRAVSKNMWISMVARVYQPGCKYDNMPILEGKQGTYKSTALSVIGGRWYTETAENPNSKDFYMVLQGKILVELAEMDSFNKAETNTIKKVISSPVDRYRAPYEKSPRDFPRQSTFIGTTNDSGYLKDPTGGRRFWPVKTGAIDIDGIKQDRDQLFSEAVALYKQGVRWHDVPKEMAEKEQAERLQSDEWTPAVAHYIERSQVKIKGYVTIAEVLEFGIKMDVERMDRRASNRIGAILRTFGMEPSKGRIPGVRHPTKIWKLIKSDEPENTDPELNKPYDNVSSLHGVKNHAPTS